MNIAKKKKTRGEQDVAGIVKSTIKGRSKDTLAGKLLFCYKW